MAEERSELIHLPLRKQAQLSVRQFEAENRLACAPEREVHHLVTNMHSLTMQRYCFSPDGTRIAIASRWKIYLYDLPTEKIIRMIDANEWAETIAFTPDGRWIVTGGASNTVRFWDTNSGICQKELTGHQRRILRMEISPSGRWLVSGDYYAVGVWDLENGTRVHWLDMAGEDSCNDFALSPDERSLYIGVGKSVRQLDLTSGVFLREITRSQKVHQVALSADEQTLIVKEGGNYSLRLVDLRTESEESLQDCYSVGSFTLSPDRRTLATGHEGHVRLWDLESRTRLGTIEDFPVSFSPIVFSPDHSQLLAHGRGLQLYTIRTGHIRTLITLKSSRIHSTVFATNGKILVTEGLGCEINVWDLQTGKARAPLIGHTDDSSSSFPSWRFFRFSPDGKLLATRTRDQTLRIWDIEYGRCMQVWDLETSSKANLLAFHPNGRVLAYNDGDKIIIRNLRTNEILSLLPEETHDLRSIEFSSDGRFLVSLDQEFLRQWDAQTGQCLQTIHLMDFCEVSKNNFLSHVRLIDPDKLTFILGEFSFEEKPQKALWDSQTRLRLLTFDGYDGGQVLVLPDRKSFLAYDRENNITHWSLETGKCIRRFEGLPASCDFNHIIDLALSPDLSLLITATWEGEFFYWDFQSGNLLARTYNLSEGYLWVTPPDAFAPNGWVHTDRPDLISLSEFNKSDNGQAEYVFEEDERFADYLRLYNDEEMVMTRLNDWERYQALLKVRMCSKDEMNNRLLNGLSHQVSFYLPEWSNPEGKKDK